MLCAQTCRSNASIRINYTALSLLQSLHPVIQIVLVPVNLDLVNDMYVVGSAIGEVFLEHWLSVAAVQVLLVP